MRPGSNHKSSVERALINVRVRVQTALQALEPDDEDDGDGDPAGGVEDARQALSQAEKSLRSLELKLSAARSRPSMMLADESADTSADTREWLLQNFTDHDLLAADGNSSICGAEKSHPSDSSPMRRGRSSTYKDCVADIKVVLADASVARILENCSRLDFDALALAARTETGHQLNTVYGLHLMKHRGDMITAMHERGWVADPVRFTQAYVAFLGRVDGLYSSEVLYHCAAHAVDVTATTEWLLRSQYLSERVTALDHFMALMAATVHDVGHPGRNNIFQTKTLSPLAVRYNDRSILENMHIALAFETMQLDPECNWFKLLARDPPVHGADGSAHGSHAGNLQSYVRRGMISMVLATDMAKHSGHCQELTTMVQEAKDAEEMSGCSPANSTTSLAGASGKAGERTKAMERKLFLLETVIHAADISNPCKPRHIMLGWTRRVLAEFWAQGDEERRLGLEVSPLCDREQGMSNVAKGQLGFINFVVLPFFKPLADLVTDAAPATVQLEINAAFWKDQDAAGTAYEAIFADSG